MKTPEEKMQMLREQVNAKVVWGASDREVREWLLDRHGITGSAADAMLAEAHRAKRIAVRGKALLYLAFSIPGMLLAIVFLVLQSMGRFIIIGYGSILILLLGVVSAGVFFRSLSQLLTGQKQGSVN